MVGRQSQESHAQDLKHLGQVYDYVHYALLLISYIYIYTYIYLCILMFITAPYGPLHVFCLLLHHRWMDG